MLADLNEMVSHQHCSGFAPAKFTSALRPAREEKKIKAAQILYISHVAMDSVTTQ